MGYEMDAIGGLLQQIGVTPRHVQEFEGNKFLVAVDPSDCSQPNFFFKPIKAADPLSKVVLRRSSSTPNELAEIGRVAVLPIAYDARSGYILYGYFAASKPLKALLGSEHTERSQLLSEVGVSLARFHLAANLLLAGEDVEATDIHRLWPDFLQPTIAEFVRGSGADYPLVIRYLQSFEGLREGIEGFPIETFDPEICHGDFKFDNVLVRDADAEIRIIDFTDLAKYDRHYDLGVAASELFSGWLAQIDYRDLDHIGDAIDRAEAEFEAVQRLIESFLRGYGEANPSFAIKEERVAYFAGRALIHNAIGSLYVSNYLSRYHWACLHVGATMVARFCDFASMFRRPG